MIFPSSGYSVDGFLILLPSRGPEEGFINQYERMVDMKGVNYAHATV